MIEYFYKTAKEEEFTQLSELKSGAWIHVDEASASDLNEICQLTGLEFIDLQDSLDKYEVPRIEKVHNCTLIFTRHPVEVDAAVGLYTATLAMIISPHYFITISPQKNDLIHNFLGRKNKLSTIQPNKLLINLLLKIAQDFTSQIRRVRYNVLNQDRGNQQIESESISLLARHEEILNQYLSTLDPLRTVLIEMTTGKYNTIFTKEHELLQDLINAVQQSEDLCATVVKTIRGIRDTYQIVFTNSLQKTIKLLTALTIILNIPTMIASIYGMNVSLPFGSNPYAFLIILSIILATSIFSVYLFQRKQWL